MVDGRDGIGDEDCWDVSSWVFIDAASLIACFMGGRDLAGIWLSLQLFLLYPWEY